MKKALLIGGGVALIFAAGRIAGVTECINCIDKKLTKDHNLSIDMAVMKPFRRGICNIIITPVEK